MTFVMRIGAHVSIAGGLLNAPERALKIGANCMQIFSSPPQQWRASSYTQEEMSRFRQVAAEKDLTPVFVHAVYLINLASDNPVIVRRSRDALILDIQFAEKIGAEGVIFHIGSHPLGWVHGKRDELINTLQSILKNTPRETLLIVENSAGSGTKLGVTLAQLAEIKKDVRNPRLKFCIDTAHALESGYDIRSKEAVDSFADEVERTIGWDNVVVIHANDSKTDLDSNVDRHENIGEGKIGLGGFRALLHHPKLADKPLIIETPGFEDEGPDAKNISILQKLSKTGK